MSAARNEPIRLFVIAGEESGDRLGASLIAALRKRLGCDLDVEGLGGSAMAEQGVRALFPIEELSIIGLAAVARQLPMLLGRIRETADAVLASAPDMLVIIDSPDFTHRVARRVRRRNPSIPIVNYVSPSVWAWRPGRARKMRDYVDHVLALLPFEPETHRVLGGPPCTYVGHPLIEQVAALRPDFQEQARRIAAPPVLLVLPGSRRSEIGHHIAIFGATLDRLRRLGVDFEAVLPTMPHLKHQVAKAIHDWPVQPRIVIGEADKRAAFRRAHTALAKSGTVTLELAISGVPMVTAYRAGALEAWIGRRVVKLTSVILANLVIGTNVIPEFLQADCTPEKLSAALQELMADSPARLRQLNAFAEIDAIMSTGDTAPSDRAADVMLGVLDARASR
jgi:lipid-A-disaccharide synthase